MSDIEHWLDGEVPDEIGEYLRAARAEAPRSELVERCALVAATGGIALAAVASKSSLGVGSGLLGSSGGAGAVTGGFALIKWGAGGLLAGTLFATGIAVTVRIADRGPGRESAPVARPHVASQVPSVGAPVAMAPPPASPVAPTVGSSSSSTSPPRKSVTPASTPDTRLAEELSLLGRARASLDARNPGLASELLAEHERRFGKSASLSPEARYLRLELLVSTHRREEARALAREILMRDSSGPHIARARAVLEEK